MKSKDIVLTFINALNQEDFAAAKNCLDGNMNFKGVLGSREGADVYIEDMKKMKFKYEVQKAVADENDVALLYNIDMGGTSILTAGWYTVSNGKIVSIKVIFDPRPVLK
ncbi:putative ester cyclase [Pedobacter africanus]|uniref:Ester cyclase n=1 Tax=Pedobacter africanus TaxID=151894 RepID=A0ACC6KRM9_9SPHI|nr:nuclear transport factor 2 family protein [Pedobacter africanus]MDR6782008.1 putative ester cyclase [Pedobacter africanus]